MSFETPEARSDGRVRKRRASSSIQNNDDNPAQAPKERKLTHVGSLPPSPSHQSPRVPKQDSYHTNACASHEDPPSATNGGFDASNPSFRFGLGSDDQYGAEIHWDEYFGSWPPTAAERKMNAREPRATKRSYTLSRSASYSQLVREGTSPPPWTRRHEEKMEEMGLFMTADRTQAVITENCQKLCRTLLEAEYNMPEGLAYHPDRLAKVLRRVRYRNEARVVRDVTPMIVPSPELLHVDGYGDLDMIREAMNAEWTQCDTLCGPRPKPDFVGGIATAAFTQEEKEKLLVSHTSACPNLFPENMYFPFLICEVKGSDRPIEEAERQAMHGASIATRAVIELFRKISATAEVHQKILAFSVVHNHSVAMIFTHSATIDGQKTSFFRRLLHMHRFAEDLEFTPWSKSYQVVRAIYEHFVPQHLERIRGALSRMQSPTLPSIAAQFGVYEDSQAWTPSQSSSQEDGRFKKPSLPSEARLQEENDKLRDQILEVLRMQRVEASQQREEQHKQKAVLEKQLEQQKEEFREQKAVLEKQLEQQKEEFREQKAMLEKQFEQQQEIINLLKLSKTT